MCYASWCNCFYKQLPQTLKLIFCWKEWPKTFQMLMSSFPPSLSPSPLPPTSLLASYLLPLSAHKSSRCPWSQLPAAISPMAPGSAALATEWVGLLAAVGPPKNPGPWQLSHLRVCGCWRPYLPFREVPSHHNLLSTSVHSQAFLLLLPFCEMVSPWIITSSEATWVSFSGGLSGGWIVLYLDYFTVTTVLVDSVLLLKLLLNAASSQSLQKGGLKKDAKKPLHLWHAMSMSTLEYYQTLQQCV